MTKKNPRVHIKEMLTKWPDHLWLYYAVVAPISLIEKLEDDLIADVHTSKKLRGWIQRQLMHEHAEQIAAYLQNEDARFFNALVLGVYGGDPQWAELNVADPRDELTENEEDRVNRTVGVLVLTGKEKLFPIDGQHRVAGIKQAMREKPALGEDEVTVIFVGHARTDVGMQRTRRLFVTLNQRARRVSERDIVALDEDNGLAVVTRLLIDEYPLFQNEELVAYSGSVAIPETDTSAITSILGLFKIAYHLYPRRYRDWPTRPVVQRCRPSEDQVQAIYRHVCEYWELLIENVKEYQAVLVEPRKKKAGVFRVEERNHLLFRPVGQQAMARAVECLVSRGQALGDAVRTLVSANDFWLQKPLWHNVLWDPIAQKMLSNVSPAETLLLRNAGQEPRTIAAER